MSKKKESTIKMNCPIVIFYEMHNHPITSDTIYKLLPTLKEYGYKDFAMETGKNTSAMKLKKYFIEESKDIQYILDAMNLAIKTKDKEMVDHHMQIVSKFIRPPEQPKYFDEKIQLLQGGASYFTNETNARKSKVKLLQSIQKHNINFSPVGPDGRNPNDEDLLHNVRELCLKSKNPIIAYFGIAHYNVGKLLHLENEAVYEYYIAIYGDQSAGANYKESYLRTHPTEHNINIIDLFNDSGLDHVQLIKDSLYSIHANDGEL